MAALTYSISAVHDNQLKGTETVLVRFEGNKSAATSSITSEVGLLLMLAAENISAPFHPRIPGSSLVYLPLDHLGYLNRKKQRKR